MPCCRRSPSSCARCTSPTRITFSGSSPRTWRVLACGQLFWGLMSDRFGRRPILIGGLGLYVLAALLCRARRQFPRAARLALRPRAVGGERGRDALGDSRPVFGAADGPGDVPDFHGVPDGAHHCPEHRTVDSAGGAVALHIHPVRCFRGRGVRVGGHRGCPRLCTPEYRLTLNRSHIASAVRLVVCNRSSLCYTLAMSVMFGGIMAYVGMVQQIFGEVFHRASLMPTMFALCATDHGSRRIPEFENRGTLGDAPDIAYGLAGLHRHHGAAYR